MPQQKNQLLKHRKILSSMKTYPIQEQGYVHNDQNIEIVLEVMYELEEKCKPCSLSNFIKFSIRIELISSSLEYVINNRTIWFHYIHFEYKLLISLRKCIDIYSFVIPILARASAIPWKLPIIMAEIRNTLPSTLSNSGTNNPKINKPYSSITKDH